MSRIAQKWRKGPGRSCLSLFYFSCKLEPSKDLINTTPRLNRTNVAPNSPADRLVRILVQAAVDCGFESVRNTMVFLREMFNHLNFLDLR